MRVLSRSQPDEHTSEKLAQSLETASRTLSWVSVKLDMSIKLAALVEEKVLHAIIGHGMERVARGGEILRAYLMAGAGCQPDKKAILV